MNRTRTLWVFVALAAMTTMGLACSSDAGVEGANVNSTEGTIIDAGVEGTYVNSTEGTIILETGGNGTWTQEGNAEPFKFKWTADGDEVTFIKGESDKNITRIKDGDLVLPPDMISGDVDVTFKRQ